MNIQRPTLNAQRRKVEQEVGAPQTPHPAFGHPLPVRRGEGGVRGWAGMFGRFHFCGNGLERLAFAVSLFEQPEGLPSISRRLSAAIPPVRRCTKSAPRRGASSSRSAATDRSPQRELWVSSEEKRAPEGRQKYLGWILSLLRSFVVRRPVPQLTLWATICRTSGAGFLDPAVLRCGCFPKASNVRCSLLW